MSEKYFNLRKIEKKTNIKNSKFIEFFIIYYYLFFIFYNYLIF